MTKRVMLKISGEALSEEDRIFSIERADALAKSLVKVQKAGFELAVLSGGGNVWRGRIGQGMDAVTADQMGMLATVLNCIFLKDALVRHNAKARVMSAIEIPRFCEVVRQDIAKEKLAEGEIILFAGGLGSPFFTTDTAVVLRAIEIGADTLLLAKSIDGVYTADPLEDSSAKLIKNISYEEAMAANLRVMDMSAFALCADKGLPQVRVFSMNDPDNILKVLSGDTMGTTLYP